MHFIKIGAQDKVSPTFDITFVSFEWQCSKEMNNSVSFGRQKGAFVPGSLDTILWTAKNMSSTEKAHVIFTALYA